PVSTGFRGINAYVFQGAKNIVLKNFKLFNYRGILHTILDLTLYQYNKLALNLLIRHYFIISSL
ncbi:MAG: hypothetical protein WBI74_10255, partial [Caldicoprobacterales bacterium]